MDEDEVATLYIQYGARIRWTIRQLLPDREDVEEVVQETFVRFLEHKEELAARRAAGQQGTTKAWLHRVAENLARDRLRAERARRNTLFRLLQAQVGEMGGWPESPAGAHDDEEDEAPPLGWSRLAAQDREVERSVLAQMAARQRYETLQVVFSTMRARGSHPELLVQQMSREWGTGRWTSSEKGRFRRAGYVFCQAVLEVLGEHTDDALGEEIRSWITEARPTKKYGRSWQAVSANPPVSEAPSPASAPVPG